MSRRAAISGTGRFGTAFLSAFPAGTRRFFAVIFIKAACSPVEHTAEDIAMDEAKILIADDSKMNQQILSEILGKRYDYLYADDGVQALDLLHEHFDIDLFAARHQYAAPRRLGVLEVMRQRNWLQDIPVIIISSEDGATSSRRHTISA